MLADILMALMIAIIIFAIIVAIADKIPPLYQIFRHYTKYEFAFSIWYMVPRTIFASDEWFSGDLWIPGVYLTDLLIEPDTAANRQFIATSLRIPIENTVSYIDVKIDRMRVLILPSLILNYPNQYIHPFSNLLEDNQKVIFSGHGSFVP